MVMMVMVMVMMPVIASFPCRHQQRSIIRCFGGIGFILRRASVMGTASFPPVLACKNKIFRFITHCAFIALNRRTIVPGANNLINDGFFLAIIKNRISVLAHICLFLPKSIARYL